MTSALNIVTDASNQASNAALKKLEANALDAGNAHNEERIDKAAKSFEAVFINQMLKDMHTGIESDHMFGGGNAEETYRGLLYQTYADEISEAGGFGIAEHVRAQLLKSQEVNDAR